MPKTRKSGLKSAICVIGAMWSSLSGLYGARDAASRDTVQKSARLRLGEGRDSSQKACRLFGGHTGMFPLTRGRIMASRRSSWATKSSNLELCN